ncbi:hypothetical protein ACH4UT_28585 [Streptomyces sp. NPDC020799]|uniref:hypothetical protein n=1 Tax=unclassified Streptomyces TaxID=2593676 RepID=UPI0033EAF291
MGKSGQLPTLSGFKKNGRLNVGISVAPRGKNVILGVVFVDLFAGVAGPVLDCVWPQLNRYNADVGLMATAGAIAPVTLTGIWYYETRYSPKGPAEAMRDAIAAAFVLLYLTIAGWASFLPPTTDTKESVSPLTRDVMSNFSTLTGVVVAFYFGANTVGKIAESIQLRGSTADTPRAQTEEVPSQRSPEASGESTTPQHQSETNGK